MNDAELIALATRAAARTHAEAQAIADSPAALERLLADEAAHARAGLAPVVPYHGRITDDDGSRRRRVLLAVAAVAVLLVGAIGYAVLSGSGTIEVAGPPSAGTGTGPGTAPASPPDTDATGTSPPATALLTAPTDEAAATSPSTASTTPPTSSPSTAPTSEDVRPAEPFDGWAAPTLPQVGLGDLPYLLPVAGTWSPDRALRSEFASDPGSALEYVQVWMRAVDAGSEVDAVVVVTTTFAPTPPSAGDAIGIPGWPSATETPTAEGVVAIALSSPRGAVDVRGFGLTRDEVVEIASSLRTDVENGAGWLAPSLEGRFLLPLSASSWIPVEPGAWRSGFASRNVRVLDDAGLPSAEISVSTLAIDSAGPGFLGAEVGLTDVGDTVAVTIADDRVGAVVWRRSDGTTVTVGQVGPLDATVELARSLAEVDRAAWEAATSPDTEFGDGCNGLFC